MKTKQLLLIDLPAFINTISKQGYIITRCVKNGNTGNAYVKVEYCEMSMLVGISRRVLHKETDSYEESNIIRTR